MAEVKPRKRTSRTGKTPSKGGDKARLLSLSDLDRRTKAARAAFDLRDRIVADLGGEEMISAMKAQIVEAAAVMGAMLADAAARYLTGKPIDLAEYTTLANAQRRLLADLGLERQARDVSPSLTEFMARKAAEKAAQSEEGAAA